MTPAEIDAGTIKAFLRTLFRDAPRDALILMRAGEAVLRGSKAAPLPLHALGEAGGSGASLSFAPALRDLRHAERVVALPVIWAHVDGTIPTTDVLNALLVPALPVAVTTMPEERTIFWRVAAPSVDETLSTMTAMCGALDVAVPDPAEFCALPSAPDHVVLTESADTLTPALVAEALGALRPIPTRREPVNPPPVRDALEPITDEALTTRVPDRRVIEALPVESSGSFAGATNLTEALATAQHLRPDEAWFTWAVREGMRVFGQRKTLELLGVDSVSTLQDVLFVRRGEHWYRVVGSVAGGFQLEAVE